MDKIKVQNLDLYFNHDDRFKTVSVCLYFHFPFDETYFPSLTILTKLLQKTSKAFKTEELQSYYLTSLYDTSYSIYTTLTGKTQVVRVSISFINPKYITENINIVKDAITFMFNSLLEHNITLENVELEKDILIKYLQSVYNNKSKYASNKFIKEMYKGEIQSINPSGTISKVNDITLDKIIDTYHHVINSPCYIFATGDIEKEKIVNVLNEIDLSKFTKYEINNNLEFIDNYQKKITKVNEVIESKNVNQTILFIGYRSNIRRNSPLATTLSFLSAMLGEYFHSSLFQVVREQNSLAYSIGTTPVMNKGAIHVFAKIATENVQKVKDLIISEINKYKEGIISDETFELTKSSKINDILKNGDSPFNPLYDFQEEMMGFGKINDDILIERINKITKEDLKEVSIMLVLDTIYCLKGEM